MIVFRPSASTSTNWYRPPILVCDSGTVFRLDPDMTLHRMIEKAAIPSGMGCKFSPPPPCPRLDAGTGAIASRRVLYRLPVEDDAVRDGCMVDTEGDGWAAVHQRRGISPQRRSGWQAWKTTCPAFGRSGRAVGHHWRSGSPEGRSHRGSMFRVPKGAQGMAANTFGRLQIVGGGWVCRFRCGA